MTRTADRVPFPVLAALAACLLVSPQLHAAGAYAIGERLPADGASAPALPGGQFRSLSWDELLPRGWNPKAVFDLSQLQALDDSDPRARAALDRLRKAWDAAPVRPELHGSSVRLSGFLVPLDVANGPIHEFLLVPYFGACIHTPPPPANQVVHVMLDRPVHGFYMEDPVTVLGDLQVTASQTGMGNAGYRLQGQQVSRYKR